MYQTNVKLKIGYIFPCLREFNDFNIGFSSSATNICTQCTRFNFMIKKETNIDRKRQLQAELTYYKKRVMLFILR